MNRFFLVGVTALCVAAAAGTAASEPTSEMVVVVSGTVVRTTGKPVEEQFTAAAWEGPGVLRLYNGGQSGGDISVSAGWIRLNGDLVAGPSSFRPRVALLEIPFAAKSQNTLGVRIAGNPGATIYFELLVQVPQDVGGITSAELQDLANEQPGGEDTLQLLGENGFSMTYAAYVVAPDGRRIVAAAFESTNGRFALYVIDPVMLYGLNPAIVVRDGSDVLMFQRFGGARISSDGTGEPIGEDHVQGFLNGERNAGFAISPAPIDGVDACDPFGSATLECVGRQLEFLTCVLGTATFSSQCQLCLVETGVAWATGSLFTPAAGVIYWLKVASLPCAVCAAEIAANVSCFLADQPCNTSCECVTTAECRAFVCEAEEVRSGACELPEDTPECDVGIGFIGEVEGVCSETGLCDTVVRQCPDCQICIEAEGGCAADAQADGQICNTSEGEDGICMAGHCDTGGGFTPFDELPGASDAVWELELIANSVQRDLAGDLVRSVDYSLSGHFTNFPAAVLHSRDGTMHIEATWFERASDNPTCTHSLATDVTGACVRLMFLSPQMTGSEHWSASIANGACNFGNLIMPCRDSLGRPIEAELLIFLLQFDVNDRAGSVFEANGGFCEYTTSVLFPAQRMIQIQRLCFSDDPENGTYQFDTFATLTRTR